MYIIEKEEKKEEKKEPEKKVEDDGKYRIKDFLKQDITKPLLRRLSSRYSWIKRFKFNDKMKGFFFLDGKSKETIVCSMIVEEKEDGLWLVKFDTDESYVDPELREEFFNLENRLLKADRLTVRKTNRTDYLMYKRYGFKEYAYDKNDFLMKK